MTPPIPPRKKLPIGIQTFAKIREDDAYYYVDKTARHGLRFVRCHQRRTAVSEAKKRKMYPPKFKTRLGLQKMLGVKTINEVGQAYEVHPAQVGQSARTSARKWQ